MRSMIKNPKRTFLMLAQDFDPKRHSVFGWYMSSKLDGMRAFWDGGISRGLRCPEVPFANVSKHDRYVFPPLATGLWSRYGQPIQAPNWFLDKLPNFTLDGELVSKDGFQDTVSIVKRISGSENWDRISYAAFDSPPLESVLFDGTINNTNFKKTLKDCIPWAESRAKCEQKIRTYYETLSFLQENLDPDPAAGVFWLNQTQLPSNRRDLDELLEHTIGVCEQTGQEGVMFRSPVSLWNPWRSWDLLKYKVIRDMEGTVVGYKWGKATDTEKSLTGDRTDRLLGLMGSVRLRMDSGLEFDLGCGFTLEEREMVYAPDCHSERFAPQAKQAVREYGSQKPGQEVGSIYNNDRFPRGTRITFQFRELTLDGYPKEARYFRKRVD